MHGHSPIDRAAAYARGETGPIKGAVVEAGVLLVVAD